MRSKKETIEFVQDDGKYLDIYLEHTQDKYDGNYYIVDWNARLPNTKTNILNLTSKIRKEIEDHLNLFLEEKTEAETFISEDENELDLDELISRSYRNG